ncbi:MAG: histidine phosphatase family protein [Chloroflexota bacterium]
MKTLLLLRHAKSSWDEPQLADHERPLNERGRRDAPRIGQLLRQEQLLPDRIVTSTAVRAMKTAEAVADASGYGETITATRALYQADPPAFVAVLRALPDSCQSVMLVGHNPGISEFLEELTGESEPMPTAALAHVSLPLDKWADLKQRTKGKLVALWRPRDLRGPGSP